MPQFVNVCVVIGVQLLLCHPTITIQKPPTPTVFHPVQKINLRVEVVAFRKIHCAITHPTLLGTDVVDAHRCLQPSYIVSTQPRTSLARLPNIKIFCQNFSSRVVALVGRLTQSAHIVIGLHSNANTPIYLSKQILVVQFLQIVRNLPRIEAQQQRKPIIIFAPQGLPALYIIKSCNNLKHRPAHLVNQLRLHAPQLNLVWPLRHIAGRGGVQQQRLTTRTGRTPAHLNQILHVRVALYIAGTAVLISMDDAAK